MAVVKKMMRRATASGQCWRKALLSYNDTPQRKLGNATPAELFLSRKVRTWLPVPGNRLRLATHPHRTALSSRKAHVEEMARGYDRGARRLSPLRTGDEVRIQPTKTGERKWKLGVVKQTLPNRQYEVQSHGETIKRNRRHLKLAGRPSRYQPDGGGTLTGGSAKTPMNKQPTCLLAQVPTWMWSPPVRNSERNTPPTATTQAAPTASPAESEEDFEDAPQTPIKGNEEVEAAHYAKLRPRETIKKPSRLDRNLFTSSEC